MNNPLQMIQAITNPKEFIKNYMKTNSNPIMNNLIEMAEKNDKEGLEKFARNMFKEQGQDFDEIYKQLMPKK